MTAPPGPPPPPDLAPETHRALAVGLYNRAWELLAIENRSAEQDDELVAAAHASAWHWSRAGAAVNAGRAHWLCSRVYATLGRREPAVHHARRANEIVAAGGAGFEDWDAAAAAEAMARALAVTGDAAGAAAWRARAVLAVGAITDPEDRAVIEADLATLPA